MAPRTFILEPTWPPELPTWRQDGPKTPQLGPNLAHVGANMAPRTSLLEPTWPHNPPLGTNMAPGAPNLEPRWAQDPSNWPQLGPNPPKLKPKSIQKCATLSCRILAHNANMKCQTKLPKQMPSQTAKTQEGGGDSRSVLNIYIYIYIYIWYPRQDPDFDGFCCFVLQKPIEN